MITVALDDLAAQRVDAVVRPTGESLEPADPGASPSECAALADETLRLAAALTTLPEDYQTVIALRNLERLPFDEVAKRMERSRPAAQMLWMRALKKLSEQMGESELLKVDVT